ncbi:MAG: Spy/CpxP family protein refolding chaperone [Ignavibacteriae bacterium]|nr:Spy/CpxP family protein refolding chaperone [Ignavibacteriota bacterium]
MQRTIGILFLVFVTASSLSLAQPDDPPRRMMEKRLEMREMMMDRLNLTADQKTQMQKLHIDMQKRQAQQSAKIRTAQLELKELFLAEKLDRSAIEKAMKNIADLRQQAALSRVDHWFAVNAILTPEQQKIWKEHFSMMDGELGEGMNRMHHRGPRGMAFHGGMR